MTGDVEIHPMTPPRCWRPKMTLSTGRTFFAMPPADLPVALLLTPPQAFTRSRSCSVMFTLPPFPILFFSLRKLPEKCTKPCTVPNRASFTERVSAPNRAEKPLYFCALCGICALPDSGRKLPGTWGVGRRFFWRVQCRLRTRVSPAPCVRGRGRSQHSDEREPARRRTDGPPHTGLDAAPPAPPCNSPTTDFP